MSFESDSFELVSNNYKEGGRERGDLPLIIKDNR